MLTLGDVPGVNNEESWQSTEFTRLSRAFLSLCSCIHDTKYGREIGHHHNAIDPDTDVLSRVY